MSRTKVEIKSITPILPAAVLTEDQWIAIVLTITVASKVITDDSLFSWIAWGAAIATGLLTSFNLGTKSNNMRNAWRMLNEAKIRYEIEKDMSVEKLVDAYRDGEKLIGDVVVNL